MNTYPTKSCTVTQLLGHSFSNYFKTLKSTFWFILLATAVQDVYLYTGLPTIQVFQMIAIVVMVILSVYFWSCVLFAANEALEGKGAVFSKVCKAVYHKWSAIYSGFFALILALCAIFFIGYLISTVIILTVTNKVLARALSYLLLVGLPMTILLVEFFFALPLLILERVNTWAAFRQSAQLIGYKYWLHTFSAYAAIVIVMFIISPATRHGHWLQLHYLSFPFDAIMLILLVPLIVNFSLFLLHDLRLSK